MANTSGDNLAFVRMATPVPNVYVGGLMVTDTRGMPLAFQYTEPIEPNRIQQILYGQSLSRYIKQDVMLASLLKGLSAKYDCVLVDDDHLLTPDIGKLFGKPVVRVSDTNNVARLKGAGTIQAQSDTEFLLQPTEQANPIRCRFPLPEPSLNTGAVTASVDDDGASTPKQLVADTAVDNSAIAVATVTQDVVIPPILETVLAPAAAHMDLVEPLRRIDKALEAICAEAGVGSNTAV